MSPRRRTRRAPRSWSSDKQEDLLQRVRRLALKQQRNFVQTFLSLREAAKRFSAPVSAVAAVYQHLREEGIFSSVRGSHTKLLSRGKTRSLKVRGLIAMPASMWRFHTFVDHQRCFRGVRDELHARGFFTTTLFFERSDDERTVVLDWIKRQKVDSVVWILPDGLNRDMVLRLGDAGIRVVGVNITPLAGLHCRYELRRQKAIRAIIHDWQADPRIKGATIVRIPNETPTDQERLRKLCQLVRSEKVECEIATVPDARIETFLKSACAKESGGVILPAAAAALLSWRAPATLMEVLQACRVALIDGPMYLPFASEISNARVDLVTARWTPLANRLAEDFITGAAFRDGETISFDAEAHPQALPSEFLDKG